MHCLLLTWVRMNTTYLQHRHIEVDLLRTVAISCMVLYHASYDLWAFYNWDINPFAGGWWLLARSTATLFLLLVGVSFAISRNRTVAADGASHKVAWRKYLRRGLIIFSCGMLVSLATYLFDPATFVRFGILHMIGVSVLLLPLFARLQEWSVLLGSAVIAGGWIVRGQSGPTSLLIPFGITPPGFASVDYFPLLPWFGVVLIGYALGHAVYVRLRFRSALTYDAPLARFLAWPSRHALLIYMLHQPLLLLLLLAISATYTLL